MKHLKILTLTAMASLLELIVKLAMTASPYPTFPRKREKGQTNRYASFTLNGMNKKGAKQMPNGIFSSIF